tara:strand:- start:28334 stop:28828 length:495 start_codon:yes stop_codon:yes gene_type:complete
MKKLLLLSIIGCLSLTTFSQKLGHINVQELISLMPERDIAFNELQKYAKELESQLISMESEFNAMVEEYTTNESSYDDLKKNDKLVEIENLKQRILTFQQSAQNELQKKELELLRPIEEKAQNAINTVAEKGKYSYILDSSVGVLLYYKDSDDVLEKVKKELDL